MKFSTKLISMIISLLLIIGIFNASIIGISAIVEIEDGDYSFVKNSDGTYSVYSYKGQASDITLPSKAFGKNITGIYSNAFEDSAVNSVAIPEGYTTIGASAFYGCTNITSVSLPSTVTSLGNMAFNSCTSLSSIDLSAATSLTVIPFAVFQGDSALKTVTFPGSIKTVSDNAFAGTGLVSIELPDTIESVGSSVFMGCTDLTTVVLPEDISSLEADLFNGCTSLQTVELPEYLETIGDEAFYGCTSLSSIELPSTLTSIGSSAFAYDSSLTAITVPASVISIGGNAFYPMSVQNKITITCYEGSVAEVYCEENFVQSSVLEKIKGDANGDGEVDILDVSAIQKYRIGDLRLTDYGLSCADVNNSGDVTIRDATLIQMKLARMNVDF